jgi:hypothetical protein
LLRLQQLCLCLELRTLLGDRGSQGFDLLFERGVVGEGGRGRKAAERRGDGDA